MFKTYRDTYLLTVGTLLFFSTLLVYLILNYLAPSLLTQPDPFGNFEQLIPILLLSLVIAPVVEEFVFRSYFISRKTYGYAFYVGTVIYCMFTSTYYFIFIPLLIFILDALKKLNTHVVYFLNALLFGLIHYSLDSFTNPYTLIPVFFQFSIDLILTWIAINFGLLKSIFSHALINFTALFPMVIAIIFASPQPRTVHHDSVVLRFEKTSPWTTKSFYIDASTYSAQNITIGNLIHYASSSTSYFATDSLRYYRFNIHVKDTLGKPLYSKNIIEILKKAKLIEK